MTDSDLAQRFPASHAVHERLEHDPDRGTVMAGTRAKQLDPDHGTPYAGTVDAIPKPRTQPAARLIADTLAPTPPTQGRTPDQRAKAADAQRRARYRKSLGTPGPTARLLKALRGLSTRTPRPASKPAPKRPDHR